MRIVHSISVELKIYHFGSSWILNSNNYEKQLFIYMSVTMLKSTGF